MTPATGLIIVSVPMMRARRTVTARVTLGRQTLQSVSLFPVPQRMDMAGPGKKQEKKSVIWNVDDTDWGYK